MPSLLQASAKRLGQIATRHGERIVAIANATPARHTDEDGYRRFTHSRKLQIAVRLLDAHHEGRSQVAGFGANLGHRRPTARPAKPHNRAWTTRDRAVNCAASSAGTLLSNACGCGAPITCGAAKTATAATRARRLSAHRNIHSASAVAAAVPAHQICLPIRSPAALPGNSG